MYSPKNTRKNAYVLSSSEPPKDKMKRVALDFDLNKKIIIYLSKDLPTISLR